MDTPLARLNLNTSSGKLGWRLQGPWGGGFPSGGNLLWVLWLWTSPVGEKRGFKNSIRISRRRRESWSGLALCVAFSGLRKFVARAFVVWFTCLLCVQFTIDTMRPSVQIQHALSAQEDKRGWAAERDLAELHNMCLNPGSWVGECFSCH